MIEGVILLNKPIDKTSFECTRHLRKFTPRGTKIGHAGTLDPFATGLLIICIGRFATKHISKFMELPKQYTATAKLGQVTDTLDFTGKEIMVETANEPTAAQLELALKSFGSSYRQTPPAYSALKYKGQPLYKLARKGIMNAEQLAKIASYKQRDITLYKSSLDSFKTPFFTVTATVSQGTYIRTLMNDIAQRAGSSGAATHILHREAIGPFSCNQAVSLEAINANNLAQLIIPITDVLDLAKIIHY